MPQIRPTNLRVEHHSPTGQVLGLGTATPRLSWWLDCDDPDTLAADPAPTQTAYQIEVTAQGNTATHELAGPEQVLVPWPAAPLQSREVVTVRVRAKLGNDWTEFSDAVRVEAGLLSPRDWQAEFITPTDGTAVDQPAPLLRSDWHTTSEITGARLYITALGLFRASINGRRVGALELAPGWTSYHHRLRYHTFDVTELMQTGNNRLEVLLGQGWYRGRMGFEGGRALYGEELAALAQLEVTTADGQRHTVGTDTSWRAGASGIELDEIYDGQETDLRVTTNDVTRPVRTVEFDKSRLVAPVGPPVRITEVVPAVSVTTSPSGKTLVDFGQNVVGWVRLRVRDHSPGDEVVLRHAEVLEHGELGVRPLRSAKATDRYLLAGGAEETCEPCFTFHGFRYAEVTGVPELQAADVEAVVVGSDLRRTGWFSSSHELLNQFHRNVVWGTRGNFLDIPTDCPQRDERLGWTGDIQVFAPSASFLFDTAGFLDNWLADLAAEQFDDGGLPVVVPDAIGDPQRPAAAAWGDAAAIVPWVLYQRFGDTQLLRRQLPSMRAWVDKVASLAGPDRLWTGGFQYGDWLDPTAPPEAPADAQADPDVVATACFARSAQVVADAAAVIGDQQTAQTYTALAAEIREAFAREYVTGSGRVLSDAPTVYGQALCWALLPTAEQRSHAGRRLADLVRTSGFRISTGFVGTPLIADALHAVGETEVAYRLLLQTECPSWLYPVTMDATTIWERWDSMLPDGTINPGGMTSFNHYALGAVADWLHRTVAGLAPAAPGYRRMTVAPAPNHALDHAGARHLTPYGEAAVDWRRTGGQFELTVTLPVGTTAEVHLPDGSPPQTVPAGRHRFSCPDPCPRPQLPAEARIRDILDVPELWAELIELEGDQGRRVDEPRLAKRLTPYFDHPADFLGSIIRPRRRNSAELQSEIAELISKYQR